MAGSTRAARVLRRTARREGIIALFGGSSYKDNICGTIYDGGKKSSLTHHLRESPVHADLHAIGLED